MIWAAEEETLEKLATRKEYGRALVELGRLHPEIVVLDADLSGSTQTALFGREFPERFFNMGIAEQNMIGTAAGLAAAGKVPFASTFAIFATGRAWEQIRQSVAYSDVNVKIVATHGGVTVGDDGGSHQAIEDIGLMRILPNMTVLVPADGLETYQMIETLATYPHPAYVRLSRISFPVIYDKTYRFEIGRASIVRPGKDLTFIACGLMVHQALAAAEALVEEGIEARVINMSTIKPLDETTVITAARQTGAIVTAEEHLVINGLGSAVAETLAEHHPTPLWRVGIRDKFGISGKPDRLLDHFGLLPRDLVKAAHEVLDRK